MVIIINEKNFEEKKQEVIDMIYDIKFEDLDPNFVMGLKEGIKMGNHAFECDACNIFHHLMAMIISSHGLQSGK